MGGMTLDTAVEPDMVEMDPEPWCRFVDQDDVYEGLHKRDGGGSYGSPDRVLGQYENWKYREIEDAWYQRLADQVRPGGLVWDLDDGFLYVPADMPLEVARRAWREAMGGFEAWLDAVVAEVRHGLPLALETGVRPHDAPGDRWLVEVFENE
jgi:hypothetical protein